MGKKQMGVGKGGILSCGSRQQDELLLTEPAPAERPNPNPA